MSQELPAELPKQVPVSDWELSQIATRRWMFDIGMHVERLCRMMNSVDGERPHVYELRIRNGPQQFEGVLLILKAFSVEGAIVAFHKDGGLLSALTNAGQRLQNGSLEWQPDQWPSKEYEVQSQKYYATVDHWKATR